MINDKIVLTGDVSQSTRDVPPSSYVVNIEPFSLLSKLLEESGREKYESNEFEAGGHKWKMILFPKGDKKSDAGGGYISLYLEMMNVIPTSEVNAMFKFFLLNQSTKKYTVFEDGKVRTFNFMKNVRGFSRMISLDVFHDLSNGYVIDDCCTFGTEIVVVERRGENVTIIENPNGAAFTWRTGNRVQNQESNELMIGGFKWKLKFYHNGVGKGQGTHKSIFLAIQDCADQRPGWRVSAAFKLILKDGVKPFEKTVAGSFCAETLDCGDPKFQPIDSCTINDNINIEVKITFLSMLNSFIA